ncbi:hypothetical protein HP550_12985 [Cellulomonas humilata]|uniref:Uncharacterized protein n=1 Tax=Cellulomonas humilata TaxID=144055 RepID=A0A7Y6A1R2_9CELL|nr:hypothetical protein [Cellulomonas humilata]NUU18164.1 hypothetical protein [Cellulomonas humilata]
MDQIDLRAAAAGVVAGMLGYLVVAVLLGTSEARPLLVLAGAQLGVLALVGALVALLQRRRFGTYTRTAALRTALTAGGAGLVVVLVLGAGASAAADGPGLTPAVILVNAAVWLGGTGVGAVLVRPGEARALRTVRAAQ